jgi:predicted enzyme related to lactoylglutathione lyase
MTASSVQGRRLWYELMTTDMAAAEAFYTAIVGWTTAPFDGSPAPYHMWMRSGGLPVGGVMTLSEPLRLEVHRDDGHGADGQVHVRS